MSVAVPDEAALKKGEKVFRQQCRFVAGADHWGIMPPPDLPEVAFAGRSNVGKSSLINALTGTKGLARASNTPGRTQQINFFELGDMMRLVDLPGYGYAVASRNKVHEWTDLIHRYLKTRPTLRRVCLLIDARHGFKDHDKDTMIMLDTSGASFLIVLTKADKVKPTDLKLLIEDTERELRKHVGAFPSVFATSSVKNKGIAELRAFLAME